MNALRCFLALVISVLLAACGGGDSSTTTVTGGGLNPDLLSPPVATQFTPSANNLRLMVEDVPSIRGFRAMSTNTLYADVTVCDPSDSTKCVTIDHVLVDTGSVGLRILASKVSTLNLPAVLLSQNNNEPAWECLTFVSAGMWGRVAFAEVRLGQQTTKDPLRPRRLSGIPIQLIEDTGSSMQPTADCNTATDNNPLDTAEELRANGILGISSTKYDCGLMCTDGAYTGFHIQYYHCPITSQSSSDCAAAKVAKEELIMNPISALPDTFNNGFVIKMPSLGVFGAASAAGELILGVNTYGPGISGFTDNTPPGVVSRAELGIDDTLDSFLFVKTKFRGTEYVASYLDSGTNALVFSHSTFASSVPGSWYSPAETLQLDAEITDWNNTNPVFTPNVAFQVGNSQSVTNNAAVKDNAASAPANAPDHFAWGMPFFYGKAVYMTIWDMQTTSPAPWYAWAPI